MIGILEFADDDHWEFIGHEPPECGAVLKQLGGGADKQLAPRPQPGDHAPPSVERRLSQPFVTWIEKRTA